MEPKKEKKLTGKHLCIQNWGNGVPDDVVLRESITWGFLPMNMAFYEGKLIYVQ